MRPHSIWQYTALRMLLLSCSLTQVRRGESSISSSSNNSMTETRNEKTLTKRSVERVCRTHSCTHIVI
jgi:hypothetical protein